MDRLRAVRQDLIVQNLEFNKTNHLLELMIPFYLEARFKFFLNLKFVIKKARFRCEIELKWQEKHKFYYDRKLHSNELDECFSKWLAILNESGIGSEKVFNFFYN